MTDQDQSLREHIGNSASLLDALSAATKWPAFLLCAATMVLFAILSAGFTSVTGYFAMRSGVMAGLSGFVGLLVCFSVALIGANAVGIYLSDDVWERRQRSVMECLIASVFTCHRLLAVLIVEFVAFLLVLLVLAMVLFLCKIPGIGPLLFALVLPSGTITVGVLSFALLYLAIPLASPAVWSGLTVMQTLMMVQALIRRRLLATIVMMVLLGLMVLFISGVIAGILVIGSFSVWGLSAAVIGIDNSGLASMVQMFRYDGMASYAYASGFGFALLVLAGAIPGFLVSFRGMTIIYREVSKGISTEEDQRAFDAKLQAARERAQQAKAQMVVRQEPVTQTAPVAGATLACPSCSAPIQPQDTYCGECGKRIQ